VVEGAQTLSTDDPDIVMLVGVRVALMPADGVAVSWTVPVKPPCEVIVIDPVLQLPCATVIVRGVLELVMVKSWTLTVTFAVWDRDPLIPVTVTM
jgi:hypothetical protein